MRWNTIVNRYIFSELVPPFFLNLIFLSFIFLMFQILEITNMVINYRVEFSVVLKMILYSMPFITGFTIPMSVMMGILLTFLRLSHDNEIIALKSGGISLYKLLPPVLLFCLIGFIFTITVTVYILPRGNHAFKQLAFEIASANIDIALKERTFNDSFKDIVFYVNSIDIKKKILKDVFIQDQRGVGNISVIVAKQGIISSDSDELSFTLRLFDGNINQVNMDTKLVQSIRFNTYDFKIQANKSDIGLNRKNKNRKEMTISELCQYLKSKKIKDIGYNTALMEVHERLSIPFACFALGILAVSLGIASRDNKRVSGFILGMCFFIIYYLLLSIGWSFGKSGIYAPALGIWMPNIIMGCLGIYLLVRVARERSIKFKVGFEDIKYCIQILKRKFN